ncbi:hypothetical protein A6302_03149 [Methylobrevis pamukkalensis]|uniref:Lambda phage tail tape-measure protein n=1 Tax=Methylobrevis pamukkalensis TaxID=1439726 RepID=A0A1E3H054_9HYPH|nr:hypothetical protein A6302_03149 [Methylobrevis pamukkalensis]
MSAKVDWIKDKFYGLYDAVVGHSYIPDLVDGVEYEMVDRLGGVWDRVGQGVEKAKGVFDGMGSSITGGLKSIFADGKVEAEEFRDFAVGIFQDMTSRILDHALKPLEDALDNLFSGGAGGGVGAPMDLGAVAGGGGAGGGMFGGLFDGLSGMFSGLVKGLGSMLTGLFSGVGGLFSSIFGLFGGFFADGGMLGAGQWGVVGERGPEILGPSSAPRRISPISLSPEAARGGGGGMNVNSTIRFDFSGYMSREDVAAVAEEAARRGTEEAVQRAAANVIPIMDAESWDRR